MQISADDRGVIGIRSTSTVRLLVWPLTVHAVVGRLSRKKFTNTSYKSALLGADHVI